MSKVEQVITEIEDYIESCRFQPLSSTKIIVNKEELEEFLVELRLSLPDEITKSQKILINQDAILENARTEAEKMVDKARSEADETVNAASVRADSIVAEATAQTNEMLSEHEIILKAQQEAARIIAEAQSQADGILANAVQESNEMRYGCVQYTDQLLASLQTIVSHSLEDAQSRFTAFSDSMQSSLNTIAQDREQISRSLVSQEEAE